ncbi:hypothetical protein [Cryptosporidium hominis TU502]|uniref:hypothetical protein n=1 Tax=Cryptosporidium hominis (strain TU502) TaxID=353151 RepID=UPI0000452983|nr:hypothetical protein [Cryptosporidium hominis TU502]
MNCWSCCAYTSNSFLHSWIFVTLYNPGKNEDKRSFSIYQIVRLHNINSINFMRTLFIIL